MLWLIPGGRTPPAINAYVYHTVSQDHEMGADQNSRHLRIFLDFFMIFSCFFHFFTLKNSFSWLEMALTPYVRAKNWEEPEKLGPKKLQSQQLGKKRKNCEKFNFFHDFGCFSPWPTDRPTDGPTDGDEKCSNNNSNTNMHAQTHTCTLFQFLIDIRLSNFDTWMAWKILTQCYKQTPSKIRIVEGHHLMNLGFCHLNPRGSIQDVTPDL